MNRNQQTHMGPSDACYYADHGGCPFPTMCECSCHKSLAGDSTPPATPVEPRVDAVAREVAKALMTNGLGERCDRLALLLGGSPIGAGWSLSGATAQIRETLEQEGYVLDRMAEADRRARASHPSAVSGEGERQGNYYGHRLTAGVSDGRVVIAVGVETLAHAVAYADWSNPFDDAADEYIRTFAIADAPQFAKDMVSAMLAEREDGSTPLSEFLDRMARAAIEDGSLGLDDAEYRIKHGEHAPCETWARASTPTPGTPR